MQKNCFLCYCYVAPVRQCLLLVTALTAFSIANAASAAALIAAAAAAVAAATATAAAT